MYLDNKDEGKVKVTFSTEEQQAISRIENIFLSKIESIYVCTKKINVGDYTSFTAVELYVNFSKDIDITINLRETLSRLFEQDEDSEVVFAAYPYEGYLPENMEVKQWTRN